MITCDSCRVAWETRTKGTCSAHYLEFDNGGAPIQRDLPEEVAHFQGYITHADPLIVSLVAVIAMRAAQDRGLEPTTIILDPDQRVGRLIAKITQLPSVHLDRIESVVRVLTSE